MRSTPATASGSSTPSTCRRRSSARRGSGAPRACCSCSTATTATAPPIAARLGVPHLRLPAAIPGSPFAVVPVINLPGWHEIALWWPERRTLVVAELIGTNEFFALGGDPAGIHPLLRLTAPGALRGYEPEHLLVGHGRGVHGPAAAEALAGAYDRARKDLPRLALRLSGMARAAVATRRPR